MPLFTNAVNALLMLSSPMFNCFAMLSFIVLFTKMSCPPSVPFMSAYVIKGKNARNMGLSPLRSPFNVKTQSMYNLTYSGSALLVTIFALTSSPSGVMVVSVYRVFSTFFIIFVLSYCIIYYNVIVTQYYIKVNSFFRILCKNFLQCFLSFVFTILE